MPSLLDLPAELLYTIHLDSLSSALPCACRSLYHFFAGASATHKARYLSLRHPHSTLSRAVKYGICDLAVIHALERISAKPLRCPELPRRLAKADSVDLDLITYLLVHFGASPDSKKGYFLARGVFFRNLPLIHLLLEHGADPAIHEGYAVIQAINSGDLELVKLLMEPPSRICKVEEQQASDVEECSPSNGKSKKRRRTSGSAGTAKRRKAEPRCRPTPQMLEVAVRKGHWDVVDYLRSEQGAVPTLEALLHLVV